jgi:hypothetical protein
MSLTKTVTKVVDNQTVAESASLDLANSTAIGPTDTSTLINLAIECTVTYHASATAGCTVKLYASYDGTNYDSDPYDQFDLPFTANTTKSQTFAVNPAPKYLKVGVTNLDTAQDITAFSAWAHTQVA